MYTVFKNMIIAPAILFCKIIGSQFIELGLMTSSVYNLVAITIFQYLEIVHPTSALTKLWKRHLVVVAVSPWIIGFTYHIYLDIVHAVIINNICYAVARWSSPSEFVGATFSVLVSHLIPVVIFCLLFPQMIRRLTKPKSSISQVNR